MLLSTKNLRVRKLCRNFIDRYVKLFKIIKIIDKNVYNLKLPLIYKRLYNTFYISLFKSYRRRIGEAPTESIFIDNKEHFLVEKIINKCTRNGNREFLI